MAIRAFLSFVYEDLNVVNMFRGQAKNKSNQLEFADFSIKEPFNSQNADYIKRQIATQIKLCTMTICLYGPTTYTSKWVNWELSKSVELGKPIMGVSLYSDGRIKYYPAELKNHPKVKWDIEKIVLTMKSLAG